MQDIKKFIKYLSNQEKDELEVIKKITTDRRLNSELMAYILKEYEKDRDFITEKLKRRKMFEQDISFV